MLWLFGPESSSVAPLSCLNGQPVTPASEASIVCGAGGARGGGRGRFQGGVQAAQAQPQGRAHPPGLQPHEAGARQIVHQWWEGGVPWERSGSEGVLLVAGHG